MSVNKSERAEIIKNIDVFAFGMQKKILNMALTAGAKSSHLGGGLSMVDIIATLFEGIMRHDTNSPLSSERDRFILSKGHGVLGYYSALSQAGYLSEDELQTFEQPETELLGHPVINRRKGIEFSTGSLGMGLSLGIGVALSLKRKGSDYRVFVLMGDGESNEGSVWEGVMAASQFELENLTVIVDRNCYQQTGANENIMSMGDVASKFQSFGWEAFNVDGHDVSALYDVLGQRSSSKPHAVIAKTVKGKGVSFIENNNSWHHAVLTKSNYEDALEELMQRRAGSR